MLRYAFVCLLASVLTLFVLACGDDDDDTSGSPSPSGASPTATFGDGRTSPPTASATDAPPDGDNGDDDEKTPPPGDGGDDDDGPAPTAPGPTPTAPPTASVGTPAPEVPPSVLADYQGQNILNETCSYNPNTAQVLCTNSIYAIDPPIVGQDITCNLFIIQDKPVLINCYSAEPYRTVYYKVPE